VDLIEINGAVAPLMELRFRPGVVMLTRSARSVGGGKAVVGAYATPQAQSAIVAQGFGVRVVFSAAARQAAFSQVMGTS
jgi:hypothetical protein